MRIMMKRWQKLVFAKRTPGVCRVCGCTERNACYHPDYGSCWWWDAEETLCSHCAIKHIYKDPLTLHRVKDKPHDKA